MNSEIMLWEPELGSQEAVQACTAFLEADIWSSLPIQA